MLVAILMFLASQLSKGKAGSSDRILMAAHTNVAVDRVLNGLLEQGFTGKTFKPCFLMLHFLLKSSRV